MLHEDEFGGIDLANKSNNMGIFGTLIVYGPVFKKLGEFLVEEFDRQPRIGGQNWTTTDNGTQVNGIDPTDQVRLREKQDGLLWTAANLRGFVVVKFGVMEIDGARRWLRGLLTREGTVERVFGHQALICLR